MKLMNAMTRFERQQVANSCSVHTQHAYARDLAAFARRLGENPALSAIKSGDLARFLISDAVLLPPDGSPRKPITIQPPFWSHPWYTFQPPITKDPARPRSLSTQIILAISTANWRKALTTWRAA